MEAAKSIWQWTITEPMVTSLKIDRDRLNQFSKSQLKQIKTEFDAELEALETESGIWNKIPTWYILGHKS